jgi:hypothetical protein
MTDRLSRAIPGHLDGLFFVPPRGIVPGAKLQPGNHFEAVLGRNSPGKVLPRLFGPCVALWRLHSVFRTGRAGRLPRIGSWAIEMD